MHKSQETVTVDTEIKVKLIPPTYFFRFRFRFFKLINFDQYFCMTAYLR